MKIVQFHSSLTSGGVEAMVVGLANSMSKSESVDVCLMYKPKESDIFLKKLSDDITVYDLGKVKSGFSLAIPFRVIKFLRSHKYDVAQLHGFFYYYMLAVLLLHKKIKFFYTVHNDAPLENTKWDRRLFFIKKLFFKWKWLHPITISDSSQKSFEELYPGCENTRVFNGISRPELLAEASASVNKYRFTSETKVFINPGRICEQKNQLALVKAFTRLIDEGNDIALLIAGQTQDRNILSQLKPYFSGRIVYLGEIDNIPSVMAGCDAMCLLSKWEGLPVVLLESLAVGCIPVCSPVGGVPDIVHDGVNGLLSRDSNEDDIYDVISRFLTLPKEEIETLSENCKRSFEKYEIQNTCAKYLEAYRR